MSGGYTGLRCEKHDVSLIATITGYFYCAVCEHAEVERLRKELHDAGDGDTWQAACHRVEEELESLRDKLSAAEARCYAAERAAQRMTTSNDAGFERVEQMIQQTDGLQAQLSAAEARYVGGACHILSGKCDCTLCKQDAKIAELSGKIGELEAQLAAAEARCEMKDQVINGQHTAICNLEQRLADGDAELADACAENYATSQLLDTVCDAYECGEWNAEVNMKQLHLTRDWYQAVLACQGGEDE